MILRKVVLRHFRKFRGTFAVTGFEEGVNKFVGVNETGKSTIAEAIVAAVLYRHSSTVAMRTYQTTGDKTKPEVELHFTLDGVDWKLWKKFAGPSGKATIEGGGRRADDDEAEEELGRLFGVDTTGRGKGQAGVWGALWVSQLDSLTPPEFDKAARETLHGVIEEQVGKVAGGERGRRILDAVRKERDALLGDRGPKGELRSAAVAADEAREALRRAEDRERSFRADADELDRISSKLEDPEGAAVSAKLAADAAAAKARAAEDREASGRRLLAVQSARSARLGADDARNAHERRIETAARLAEAEASMKIAAEVANASREALQAAGGRTAAAEAARQEAETAWRDAEAASVRSKSFLRGSKLRAAIDRSEAVLATASAVEEEVLRLKASIAANPATREAMADYEKKLRQFERLMAQVEAASPVIEFDLVDGADLSIDGKAVAELSFKRTATSDMSIELGGLGRIGVRLPVAGERGELKRKAVDAKAVAVLAAAAMGVAEFDSAVALEADRKADELSLANAQGRLASHVQGDASIGLEPGIEGLRLYLDARRQDLKRLLASLGATDIPPAEACLAGEAEAENRLSSASQVRVEAIVFAEAEARAASTAVEDAERAVAALRALEAAVEREGSALAAMRAREGDESLEARLLAAIAEADAKEAEAANLPEVDAEVSDRNAARLEKAVAADLEERRAMETERRILEASIRERRGSGEAVHEARASLEAAEALRRRLGDQAEVAAMLCDVLGASEREAKERYVAPVKAKMMAHLPRILPGAEAELDEEMQVGGIVRNGLSEELSTLSVGTREQLAILVRIAFADMLVEKGRPAMLLLDDVLAHADAERLDEMFGILDDAAQRMQVIAFTCHDAAWKRLPAAALKVSRIGD